MEPRVLIVFLILGVPLFTFIWLIVRAVKANQRIEELTRRLGELELDVIRLRQDRPAKPAAAPVVAPKPETMPVQTLTPETPPVAPAPLRVPPNLTAAKVAPAVPPPVPPQAPAPATPPSITPPPTVPWARPVPELPPRPAINWEQFMGVKGFAWVGGFALFLGIAFFIKYSFDNNLVPPELRVAIGFVAGLGLLVGGVLLSRKNYPALAQTLCATGVVALYAVTFACRSVYHFEFFGAIPTFLLMGLITTTAFLVAVRLNALVVAILGMLGGFLTPVLLSTGVDNPAGLFGYIAILDTGLLLVALNRRWHFLTALAAAGTALMQAGWAGQFFEPEKYFAANKILIVLAVLLGFNLLYLAAVWWARRQEKSNHWLTGAALGLVAVALAFMPWLLSYPTLAGRPGLMFGFALIIDLVALALVLLEKRVALAQPVAGLALFGLLAWWTSESLTNGLLTTALIIYLLFAVLHAVIPLLLQRRHGITTALWGTQLFPPLALALVLIPIFKLTDLSFAVWPFVLLVDLLAIGLAAVTATLLPVAAVLLLTLAATAALILKIPAELTGMSTFFLLLGGFAIFFVGASVWLARKLKRNGIISGIRLGNDLANPENLAGLLPAVSAALPFLLLIMATLRLPLVNPAPVFGLALLLVVLLLGLGVLLAFDWIPLVTVACVAALECAWHFQRFDAANPDVTPLQPLAWYLIFYGIFTLFPFVFLKKFREQTAPWAAAALAGLPHFLLIYRLVRVVWPNSMMGLLPAAFAVPPLLSLVALLKKIPATTPARMTQLAWFGGVALFFITLIFPIQFERQWLTIGWALEGAALLWLFHRVPHPGLRLTGVGLLLAAFARLACNPAVFDYHARSATPILNWYLYSYGIVTVCLFAGMRLLAPPRNRVLNSNVPPLLATLGTILAFLLMNLEIADYFTPAGAGTHFEFGGNFAREMTYTIAWALFALVLIVIGIARNLRPARYAAMALLGITLLKLFFHDLANLNQLYRIGAFVGVAVIAMLASFAYQRFYAASAKDEKPNPEVVP